MSQRVMLPMVFVLAASCGLLRAGAPCCNGCGCQPCTHKVCRLICETKKVPTPVYSCECEDFCLPGPSIKCKVPCNCPGNCCHQKYHIVWKPTCGKVRTRKNLVVGKKEKEVPSYRCVVEEVCTRCGHCAKRTSYPVSGDAKTAVAMAAQQGADTAAIQPSDASLPIDLETAALDRTEPTDQVASRGFVDRLFTRR